jgi:PAS domain S-box-containing protein
MPDSSSRLRQLFKRKLRFVTAVPLIIGPLFALALLWVISQLVGASREVEARDRAIAQAHHSAALLRDLETGQRGYLLTGRREFLEPYLGSYDRSSEAVGHLSGQVAGDAQRERVRQLGDQLEDWKNYAARTIRERDIQRVARAEGKRRMDAMRGALASIVAAEEAERARVSARAERVTRLALALVVVFGLVLGMLAALLMRRLLRGLRVQFADALERTRQTEEQYRALLNGVRDYAIYMLSPEGIILSWNAGAEKIKGYSARDVIGRHFSLVFLAEERAAGKPDEILARARANGRFEEEGWRQRKDGSRFWADEVITALYHPDGALRGFCKVTRDYTQRREFEQERTHLIRKLEEAVASRDEFLTLASHELKTPLTALRLKIQSIARGKVPLPPDPEGLKELHRKYLRQLDRLQRLIDEMLDLARIQSGRLGMALEPVDLGELVRDVGKHATEEFRAASCELRVDSQPGIVGTWDRFRVEQVLANFLSNAIRFGCGGMVELKAGTEGEQAFVSVTDHGDGIAEADRGRIFERFHRVANIRHHGGLGLGLYISREIAARLGGEIRLESSKGMGARFTLLLPLKQPESRAA